MDIQYLLSDTVIGLGIQISCLLIYLCQKLHVYHRRNQSLWALSHVHIHEILSLCCHRWRNFIKKIENPIWSVKQVSLGDITHVVRNSSHWIASGWVTKNLEGQMDSFLLLTYIIYIYIYTKNFKKKFGNISKLIFPITVVSSSYHSSEWFA